MNYYWWSTLDGEVGNVYAKDSEEAVRRVEESFGVKVFKLELLKEKTENNHFINGRHS